MGLRLNIGAGDHSIPGYQSVDRADGEEAYPLKAEDGSVSEIRASHVLEHFSHRDTLAVLADWHRALEPGGLIRIAVPDFQVIAEMYLDGKPIQVEGYVMGGHVDHNDHHGALFDADTLADMLQTVGFRGVCRWTSEIKDCAALPISLNLQAWKMPAQWPMTIGVMSVPRLGFMDNAACAQKALSPLRIPVLHVQGAFWGQCLTRGIESALQQGAEYVLTMDYDSVYSRSDVESLISAAMRNPHADAIAPVQAHRGDARCLFTMDDGNGAVQTYIDRAVFSQELVKAKTAHFGLTLFRASSFSELTRPWFHSSPDPNGGWDDERTDDDVAFWRNWEAADRTLYIASRVAIGHAELVVRWPDKQLGVIYQRPGDFHKQGKPEGAWR